MGPRSKKESEDFDGFLSLEKDISKRKSPSDTGNAFLLLGSAGKKGFGSDERDLSASKDQQSAPYFPMDRHQGLQPLATNGPTPTLSNIKYDNITCSMHE